MISRRSLIKIVATASTVAALPSDVAFAATPREASTAAARKRMFHYGWVRDLPRAGIKAYGAPLRVAQNLPKKVDLRPKMPPVYDQGQIGSCVSNAVAGAVQFLRMADNQLPNFVPSRLFIYYNGREIEGKIPSDSGLQLQDAITAVERFGVCPESEWPYDATPVDPKTNLFPATSRAVILPPRNVYSDSYPHRAIAAFSIPQRLDQMQGCLAEGFPFAFGFTIYPSFYDPKTNSPRVTIPVPSSTDIPTQDGHAVLAVGYDDSNQIFICRNSWNVIDSEGNGVQDHGHFYMPYNYLTSSDLAADFWTIRRVYSFL